MQRCADTLAAEIPKMVKNVVFVPDLARETDQPLLKNVSCRRRAAVLASGFGFRIQGVDLRTTTSQKCEEVPRRARI